MLTLDQFRNQYIAINEKKGVCRIKAEFFSKYNGMTIPQAYNHYCQAVGVFFARKEKINKFEAFLKEQGCEEVQSNISESRYYFYNGVKYRFSSHTYPTGSMTKQWEGGSYAVVDFCADPQIIETINF